VSDDRKPKPNVATAEPPASSPVPDTSMREAEPSDGTGPKKVRMAKRAGPKKESAEAPKLPRLGELQRLVLISLPTISVTELAERLDVTRPSASRALHGLDAMGLVEPADGEVGGWKSPWRLTHLGQYAAKQLARDSVRRIHEQLVNRPHNLPTDAEAIIVDAEERLAALL